MYYINKLMFLDQKSGSSGATDNGSYYGSEDEVQIVSIKYLKMLLIVF
jgi:hypothetical protein